MMEETLAWFAGVDWGSERHQTCLLDAQGKIIAEREFPHSGAGLAELGDWLLAMAGAASTVAVAIEVPHGPVVDSLVDRGFVVHAINPKQLDRLRDRFSVAGAKDDRRDAYVLADGVRTDRRLFRRLHVADPRLIELRAWSRLAEELKEEQRRLSNRVGQQLWRYYPQMQKLTDDLAAPWFLELWTIAPTPAKARQLRKPTVERLLRQHRIVAWMRTPFSPHCANLSSKSRTALLKRPAFTCARWSLACALSIASCGRPRANSKSSA